MFMMFTTTAMQLDFDSWLSSFDWSRPSWDMLVVAFIIFGGLVYGMSLGRARLALTTVAIYMSMAIVSAAPFVDHMFAAKVNFAGYAFDIKIVAFLGLLLIVMFFFARGALFRSFLGGDSAGGFIQSLLLSFIHSGLVVSIVMNYLPTEALQNFSPQIRNLFYGEWQLFYWLCAPVAVMLVFSVKKKT